jgi:putative DNA primase/helicase
LADSRYNPFQHCVAYNAGWLSRQLGGSGQANAAGWHHCRCPVHRGDSPTALALKNLHRGQLIAKCFHGCDGEEIHRKLEQLVISGAVATGPISREQRAASAADIAEAAKVSTHQAARIWHQSRPDDLIGVYLRARCITLAPPGDLRLHPGLYHRSHTRWPAMVALIRDVEGKPIAIHRTWLMPDGGRKASVDPNKMILAPMIGGAVRLAAVTDAVLLGEGIETTMSAMHLTGMPGWSTLHTSGLRAVQLPPEIRTVTITVDHDQPGHEAARALCRRLKTEGRTVRMIRPNREDTDFNDELRERAP